MTLPAAFEAMHAAFAARDPDDKCARVAGLSLPEGDWDTPALAPPPVNEPGRPALPQLVHPREVPHRGLGSVAGRVAMTHAVAHIEFNAINLALDAALRFPGMPADYYRDWLSVAQDEARHFAMLSGRLREQGSGYGAFSAHNGLWEAAEKTADDVLARMALVPRVLEARGLDVTPGIIHRLREIGDTHTVAILEVILAEEVRHVAIGTRWFHFLCAQRSLAPEPTFQSLLAEHGARLRPPYNLAARSAAGFSRAELDALPR